SSLSLYCNCFTLLSNFSGSDEQFCRLPHENLPQIVGLRCKRAQCDQGDFGRAIPSKRHAYRSNPNIGVKRQAADPAKAPGILPPELRQIGSADQRDADLAPMGMAGKL